MTVVFILGFCPQPLQDRDTVSGLLLAVLCAVLWYHLWLILLQAPWHLCPISYQTRRFLAVCASPPIFYQLLLLSRVQPWISLCWILFFPRWVILIFILFLGSCVYCCFPSLLPEVSLPNFSMIGKSGRIRRGTYSPPPPPPASLSIQCSCRPDRLLSVIQGPTLCLTDLQLSQGALLVHFCFVF